MSVLVKHNRNSESPEAWVTNRKQGDLIQDKLHWSFPTPLTCPGWFRISFLWETHESISFFGRVKLEHGFVCLGTTTITLNLESTLKIWDYVFSFSYFFKSKYMKWEERFRLLFKNNRHQIHVSLLTSIYFSYKKREVKLACYPNSKTCFD